MEMTDLLNRVARLINDASVNKAAGKPDATTRNLVELRELLNAQPELEAGGAPEKPEEPSAT